MKWIFFLIILIGVNAKAAGLQYLVRSTPPETSMESPSTDFQEDYHTSGSSCDDAVDRNVPIGFAFPFNGSSYTSVNINSNGILYFDNTDNTEYSNSALPYGSLDQAIFPYWDDLNMGDCDNRQGSIRYETYGTAPNRHFVVSWSGVPHYYNSGSYAFQVVLYENGAIRFRYDASSSTDGSSATIGVQEDGNHYDQYSYNATIDPHKDVLYSPIDEDYTDYHFDEAGYDGTSGEIKDSHGHLDGTSHDATTVPGKICNAIDLRADGTSDYAVLPSEVLDGTHNFTISVWHKGEPGTDSNSLLSGARNGQDNAVIFWMRDATTFEGYIDSDSRRIDTQNINDGTWHHLVWRKNGTESCFYFDGAKQGCENYNQDYTLAIESLILGQEQDSVGDNFDPGQDWEGIVDELLVFRRALSDSEIQNIYNNQNAGKNWDGSPRTCPSAAAVSGHVYEDPDGDAHLGDKIAASGVTVRLYRSNGSLIATTTTDSQGYYRFGNLQNNFTYYVVVDSKTLSPHGGFNNGHSQGDVWAEQTYGGPGSECDDGTNTTVTRSSAGPCYGGRRGDRSDDASSLGGAEHRIKVDVRNGNTTTTDADFAFSFNVVTRSRDGGDDDSSNNRTRQGTLRQFVQNANAISGPNPMRFVPAVPKDQTDWWRIRLSDTLDPLQDDATAIDGTAYDLNDGTTVIDSDSGTLSGSGGKVGAGSDGRENSGDEPTLPDYEKKELEIDGRDHSPIFEIGGEHEAVRNLALYNADTGVQVDSGGHYAAIGRNFFSIRANGDTVGHNDRLSTAISVDAAAHDVVVRDNYFRDVLDTGIYFSGNGVIEGNYLLDIAADNSVGDGITVEGNQNAGRDVTIRRNYIDGASAYCIESWQSKGPYLIENNTLTHGGQNTPEQGGLRLFGEGSTVRYNLIKENTGIGIVIVYGSLVGNARRNSFSRNVIYSNSKLSIDLDQTHASGNPNGDGVTPNNGTVDSSKQNDDMDYPVVTRATWDGSTLHVEGFVGSAAGQNTFGNAHIEVYLADDDGNNNGEVIAGDGKSEPHGELKAFWFDCDAATDGTFSCDYSTSSVGSSDTIALTATLADHGTSEVSADYPIVFLPHMQITKSSCVIEDPVNHSSHPKRIPGATIRYAIEVHNSGVGVADDAMAEDNVSSHFDSATIRNLQVQSGACDCTGVSSASNNGPNGSGNGENPVRLDFGTVPAGATRCGYFEVDIK